jgi:hypothetical protein
VSEKDYTVDVVKYWENLLVEDKTKILKNHNCWEGINAYLWQYIPEYIKIYIGDEYQKSRR